MGPVPEQFQPIKVAMPELPWEKWYPTNWASEPGLRLCEAATRGIWFEAVNTMMLQQTDHISGTIEQLANLCICRTPQMQLAVEQLKEFKVADVRMQNECIILTCRKRTRDCQISDLRRDAAKSRWCKHDANAMQTPMQVQHAKGYAPSASASAYASRDRGTGEGNGKPSPAELVIFDKEHDRTREAMRDIRNKYESHMTMSSEDREKLNALSARCKELRKILGVQR